jgi:stage III sporulation protein AG
MFEFLKRNGEDEGILQKKGLWILLLAAVGLVLLLFGGRISAKEEPMPDVLYSPKEDELVLYREHIEERIQSLCQSVSGVGKVQVAVTLSGGYEAVYATEIKDGNEEYVILGSGSSATALLLSKETPSVIGVGIVCNGGADTRVKSELTALVSAAFDVPTNRIYISAP